MQGVACPVSEDGPSSCINRLGVQEPATPEMTFVFADRRATDKYSVQNGKDCCHPTAAFNFLLLWYRCLQKSDSEPERFTLATLIGGACD